MKISKLFHWLYATLMFLPLIALPIFGIYSHRHTIDSGSIQVPQNKIVDFNQLAINGDFEQDRYLNSASVTYTIEDNQCIVISSIGYGYARLQYSAFTSIEGHQYLSWVYAKNVTEGNTFGFNVYENGNSGDTLGNIYVPLNSQYQKVEFLFTALNSNNNFFNFYPNTSNTSVGDSVMIRDFCIFDLTQMFGSGNEPSLQQFNTWYDEDYYSYTLSRKELLKDYSSVTYSDTDIMSQFTYQIYNLEDKYLDFDNVFGFGNVYDWLALNIFNGNPSIYFTMFWHLLTYWLIVSLFWLVFDVLMYVPQLAHRWLDRGAIE